MRPIRANLAATPHPFLKWAGGKGQLLTEILPRIERAGAFGRYHEPFVGGGAVFFGLARAGRLGGADARLSDNNAGLIETYQAVRNDVERLIALLKMHRVRHGKEYYYAVRAAVPDDPTERAARIIYLNRTCFNGLYRENSKGEFNVPIGSYTAPRICDENNLRAVADILKTAHVEQRHFATVLDLAAPGDFVYFDPPYHPVSKTASFTAYDKGGFGEDDQRELAAVFGELTRRGIKALLSNSMTDLVRDLYGKYEIECVHATRAVNSRADRRGAVEEALVRNY
jgi:DNA adenine methylase